MMRAVARAGVLVGMCLATGGGTAAAQIAGPATLVRGDVHVAAAWQNVHVPQTVGGSDWLNDIAAARLAVGIYWTEHLRTQVDVSAGTSAAQYRAEPLVVVDGQPVYRSSRLQIAPHSIGVGQQYQFLHNAWLHPHVGGGALIRFTRRTEQIEPAFAFEPGGGPRMVLPGGTVGPTTETSVRPYLDLGFKAYLSPRLYFAHDTRIVPSSDRLDEILFSFGLGVDF